MAVDLYGFDSVSRKKTKQERGIQSPIHNFFVVCGFALKIFKTIKILVCLTLTYG